MFLQGHGGRLAPHTRPLIQSDPAGKAKRLCPGTQVWNSDTSDEARRQIMSELVSDEPEMRLLYTTPESLRNPSLRGYLKVRSHHHAPAAACLSAC